MKYLDITLTKYFQDPYAENYKLMLKEINEHLNKWRDIQCSWFGKLNIQKCQICQISFLGIYLFLARLCISVIFCIIPIKIPAIFNIEILILKFIWKGIRLEHLKQS